jgi:hypothetical protein
MPVPALSADSPALQSAPGPRAAVRGLELLSSSYTTLRSSSPGLRQEAHHLREAALIFPKGRGERQGDSGTRAGKTT